MGEKHSVSAVRVAVLLEEGRSPLLFVVVLWESRVVRSWKGGHASVEEEEEAKDRRGHGGRGGAGVV